MSAVFEYRIEVSIQRSIEDADDFAEIGFGAADGRTIDSAGYEISTMLQRREWETTGDMPDPTEVDA